MTDHAHELLLLRDGTNSGELLYRQMVMKVLGAVPEVDLPPVSMVRRSEGTITLPGLTGLVMFATGEEGRGALSDVRSKSGHVSARSLLLSESVEFVIVVTTGEPSEAMLEAADAKSDLFWLGPVLRRRIWVLGVPEIVERGERFLVARGAVPAKKGLWGWFSKLLGDEPAEVPVSPLQVNLPNRVDPVGRAAQELRAE